ncbi:MAG: heme-dependent oxidative N-demethylase subunit alpha family protein [Erythrobacter sp.]|nr:heme-dependent oxidative N-demethylase subunit alpha family protein [Erythrobacter sp.]
MGLVRLAEDEWLQPEPDLAARARGFAEFPEGIQLTPEADAPGKELAAMMGADGGLAGAAASAHEDMCLLVRRADEPQFRLVGATVAWPTDWRPKEKLGLPLRALHAPIAGYEEQLASGVDRFMETLRPGAIFGRCNWFIAPTSERRWLAESPPKEAFAHVTSANAGETLFVRCERQTLRCLPQTGAILFTIGVYVERLGALPAAQAVSLAEAMEELVAGEGERRGTPAYADALRGYAQRETA